MKSSTSGVSPCFSSYRRAASPTVSPAASESRMSSASRGMARYTPRSGSEMTTSFPSWFRTNGRTMTVDSGRCAAIANPFLSTTVSGTAAPRRVNAGYGDPEKAAPFQQAQRHQLVYSDRSPSTPPPRSWSRAPDLDLLLHQIHLLRLQLGLH